jgi:pyruvate kinase
LIIYVGGSFGIGGGSTFMEISTAEKLTFKEAKKTDLNRSVSE